MSVIGFAASKKDVFGSFQKNITLLNSKKAD